MDQKWYYKSENDRWSKYISQPQYNPQSTKKKYEKNFFSQEFNA